MIKLVKTVRTVIVIAGYSAVAWKLWSQYGEHLRALAGRSEDPVHRGATSPRLEPVNIPDDPAIDLPRAVPDPALVADD